MMNENRIAYIQFRTQMKDHIMYKINHNIKIECKNVSTHFKHDKYNIDFIVNVLFVLNFNKIISANNQS